MQVHIKAVYGGVDLIQPKAGKDFAAFEVMKLYDLEKGEAVRLPLVSDLHSELVPGVNYELVLDVKAAMKGYNLDLRVVDIKGKKLGG
ncbi:hypothetical protein [Candidatus Magnetobacterium casense]|uniref:Uncharacterized protein n=1 Tax=Candidatus Magnetobacterium casense TaxID=1455061 RepID=A0ABS6S085_9BACT|nr:hypothetical protein [Candidatus Magnetobacterium casensis]MBV6342275.1 hypothetical protein [Candidatus Magnetobacterium casensis]